MDKFVIHGPTCGFTAEEIRECLADLEFYVWFLKIWSPAVEQVEAATVTYREYAAYGTNAIEMAFPTFVISATPPAPRPPGILPRLFLLIKRLKCSPGYSEGGAGRELGILSILAAIPAHPYPSFSLALISQMGRMVVSLLFKKHGHAAVYIRSRVNGGPWEFLAIDNAKPHIDDRPLAVAGVPEIREYQMCWWDQGNPHGDWSPVQAITVSE